MLDVAMMLSLIMPKTGKATPNEIAVANADDA
jgi:hypothetical protein